MTVNYASPINAGRFGIYRPRHDQAGTVSPYLFTGRLTADGSSGYAAEPGRYHLYAGRFCPWSHRVVLQIALNGLERVVSESYVDGLRDGRGWAFRESTGPDEVNGFTLLREAYEATEPGYDGNISLPTLWDRRTERVVSNDYRTLGIDVATQFQAWTPERTDTYPEPLRADIEELDRWLGPTVNRGVGRAAHSADAAAELTSTFLVLNRRLAHSRYLLGSTLTEADVRLWVTLVRYDVGPNAHRNVGPRLTKYPALWAYARDLYQHPAFRRTTDFASFSAPFAVRPDWDQPARRSSLRPWAPLPLEGPLER
jgi:putative glutathione S-transferase